ncbi:MAG: redoxin domain-containing protein [Pseudomonadota bacterium]
MGAGFGPAHEATLRMGASRLTVRIAILACLLAAWTALYPAPATAAEKKAIQFQFVDLDGRPVRLADYRGKWVLVNFWAYWCPLCRIGIPTLNELNRRKDFVVIGVSLDYGGNVENVRDAIREHGLQYAAQVAGGSRRDPHSPFRQVGPVDYYPTSYLYDPTGEIVMYIPGQLRKGQLLAFIDNWRGAPARPTYALDLRRFESAITRRYGEGGSQAFRQWSELRQSLAEADATQKLERVNEFFNRRTRHLDTAGGWATPAETLGSGVGDSADTSIAKYFTLLSLDIPAERLRLVYTRLRDADRRNPTHMVLAYYATPEQDPLVLDDHLPRILPASQRPDLRPIFSFNSQHAWEPGGAPAALADTPIHNQPAWQRTLQRARAEGFE